MTLQEARTSLSKYAGASGICEDDERLVDLINESRRILYPLGEWDCTMEGICLCPIQCRYVLPSKYEYAKQAFICNSRLEVVNSWYVRLHDWSQYCSNEVGISKIPGPHASYREWGRDAFAKCCNSCNPEGFYIKVKFGSDADIGKELLFKGKGVRNEDVLVTRVLSGGPFDFDVAGGNDRRMIKLTHVVKPRTVSWIRVYGYDGENEMDLAHFEAEDVNPTFTIYSGNYRSKNIILKVKKRFRTLTDNNFDEVEFHEEAMIHALQAINYREAKDMGGFNNALNLATSFLNKKDGQALASSTLPIRFTKFRQNVGLIS